MKQTGEFTGKMTFYFLFYSSEESHMSYRSWSSYRNDWTLSKDHQLKAFKGMEAWHTSVLCCSPLSRPSSGCAVSVCSKRVNVGEDAHLMCFVFWPLRATVQYVLEVMVQNMLFCGDQCVTVDVSQQAADISVQHLVVVISVQRSPTSLAHRKQ